MTVSQAGVEGCIFSPEREDWIKIQEQVPLEATCLSSLQTLKAYILISFL